jgi:hypothetical protein
VKAPAGSRHFEEPKGLLGQGPVLRGRGRLKCLTRALHGHLSLRQEERIKAVLDRAVLASQRDAIPLIELTDPGRDRRSHGSFNLKTIGISGDALWQTGKATLRIWLCR